MVPHEGNPTNISYVRWRQVHCASQRSHLFHATIHVIHLEVDAPMGGDFHGTNLIRHGHSARKGHTIPHVRGVLVAVRHGGRLRLNSQETGIQAESHFKGRGLGDTWACVSLFAPDASTEGNFKADLFERFNSDHRRFAALMDRYLPDPRALDYVGRLARLTEIRAYVRAQFLREDANVDWTDIGAKVKRLVDERIDARVRELMKPVSVLDGDFEQKIAALPHDEARASIMEHAIRAEIHERLAENPVFYEKLSQQLARIIEDLRNRVIDAAEACRREEALRHQIRSEADIAAQHGLSPVSFAIYELLEVGQPGAAEDGAVQEERGAYRTHFDEEIKAVALKVDAVVSRHKAVVDWQSNLEVQREMRRDIKRELRDSGDYTEEQLDELANRIVELARRRDGR